MLCNARYILPSHPPIIYEIVHLIVVSISYLINDLNQLKKLERGLKMNYSSSAQTFMTLLMLELCNDMDKTLPPTILLQNIE